MSALGPGCVKTRQVVEVTNVGSDRAQLAAMAKAAKAALQTEGLDAVADRGYFNGEEILACERRGSRSRCRSR